MRRAWGAWWLLFAGFWVSAALVRHAWWLDGAAGGAWPGPMVPLGILALLFFAGSAWLTRRVADPIADLIAAADRVSNRDYAVRVRERGPASVRSVTRAFNDMASRLETQDRIRRQLMADIAHELRTPVTVIQGRLEGLLDGVYPRDESQLQGLLDETRVLARLVEDIRTLAHAESGTLALHKETVEVEGLMREAAEAARPLAGARQVSLDVEVSSPLPPVDADGVRLREVLGNLVANALRHTPAGGRVVLTATDDPAHIVLRVSDTGSGIAPENLSRIFDRFFKGPASTGSGLGLSIARSLVEAHGGTIAAESAIGLGTTITFTIPRG